ncbi:hypothetical protein COR50_05425 [Chitinophaga caeni]|uniref:Nucleoid-associated protein COR50_05425 n=1 Tax=Chitinophaga caeni TaxID=2029983 RepID=A0A291QRW1_9BACT|nr:YbaB/EbfC family nucleoid-associated protein [Chitinophaga caeni]ATL46666.1 hypothetical protein COR50_05425 [Chitinophaga caeni]
MFGDLMGKLQGMQQKMQETKGRLANITVTGEAADGLVKVVANGNREIKSLEIDESLCSADRKEELEDLMITALNRALKNAENVWETEMKGAAGGLFGGMGLPGL